METQDQILHSQQLTHAARAFAAIGSEPRLAVLRALVRAGPDGLTVGEIQARLEMPASTLTHHLKLLVAAGLVDQTRRGRSIYNRASFEQVRTLAEYLLEECCTEIGGGCE